MQKKNIIILFLILVLGVSAAVYDFPQFFNQQSDYLNSRFNLKIPKVPETSSYKMGLDLKGGVRLEYQADLSQIPDDKKAETMEGLRDLIERRINVYGVTEPQIQLQGESRLIVELPGVESIEQAINWIGATPWLEFMEMRSEEETQKIVDKIKELEGKAPEEWAEVPDFQIALQNPYFKPTDLTGKYLDSANLNFDQNTNQPRVILKFDSEGTVLFEQITERNVGKPLAILLDGSSIIDTDGDGKITPGDLYAPTVQEKISGGEAVITGEKNIEEAKTLVKRLNEGALPVPLGSPLSQKKIGPTLGAMSFSETVRAGLIGLAAVVVFMILYYRLNGILVSAALALYLLFILAIFKMVSVTITLAGIGGIILSIGMAVDANVLIFSRMREELHAGKSFSQSVEEGFGRAWPAIRDGNFTTLLVGFILFGFGTSFVKGFATTLNIGVIISMISALFVTKVFLRIAAQTPLSRISWLWK